MGRPELRIHPKFARLVLALGEPEPHVRGYLEYLWEVAYACGNPVIGDEVSVVLACKYPMQNMQSMQNNADAVLHVVNALMGCGGEGKSGFIEKCTDGKYQVHDLYDHAPEYVQRRMERESERQVKGLTISEVRSKAARARWDKVNTNGCKPDANALSGYANGATPAPAPAPAPNNKEPASESSTNPKKGRRRKTEDPAFPDGEGALYFWQFWDEWPAHHRKVNRKACLACWKSNELDKISETVIRSVTDHKAKSPDWLKEKGAWIPLPLSWLHQKRWEADLSNSERIEEDGEYIPGIGIRPAQPSPISAEVQADMDAFYAANRAKRDAELQGGTNGNH